ncbi:MAG: hypothetical protein ACKOXO_00595 [Cyanobium sp.]
MSRFRLAPMGRRSQPTAVLTLLCSLTGGILLAAPSPSLAGATTAAPTAASPCPRTQAGSPSQQGSMALGAPPSELLLAQAATPSLAQAGAQGQVYPACTYTPGAPMR